MQLGSGFRVGMYCLGAPRQSYDIIYSNSTLWGLVAGLNSSLAARAWSSYYSTPLVGCYAASLRRLAVAYTIPSPVYGQPYYSTHLVE
jgi:hypothetical protein